MTGLRHGSAVSHLSTPLPPRTRPAISTDAHIVNTVNKVGNATSAVNTECRYLASALNLGDSAA
jgi:hypothetical protein